MRALAVAVALASGLAAATPSLLPKDEATESRVRLTSQPPLRQTAAVGVSAALLAAPVALMLGHWVGSWSNDTYGAVIPAMLITLLLPPLATVFTEYLWLDAHDPGRFRWGWPLAAAVAVQALVVGAGVLFGASATSGAGIAALTLADAVLLPAATTGTMELTARPPPEAHPALTVPLVSLRF